MAHKPRKVTKEDLPLMIEDAAVVESWKIQSYAGRGIAIIGMIMLLCSAGITIFGPDHIYANPITGPAFWQAVQLNPGLIFIVGIVVIAGGKALSNAAWNKIPHYVDNNFVLCDDADKPAKDIELVGLPGENGDLGVYGYPVEQSADSNTGSLKTTKK